MRFTTLLAAGLMLTGAAFADGPANTPFPGQVETVASGLEHPWSIAFLPDGDILVTERAGRLRLIRDGVLSPDPVAGIPDVFASGQGGLMDVVPHPDFAENGLVYLTYAHGARRANATRLGRGRYVDGRLEGFEAIFTANRAKDTDVHYGGRLAFLNDGTLLLTLGDGFDYREEAQRPANHLGSIVRLNDDGSIPADNPFAADGDAAPETFSFGHRNPQAILVDRASGRIYAHEHGPRGGDELNLIEAGRNYGWPVTTYGTDYTGALVTPYETYRGMAEPLLDWTPSIAPAGMALYEGGMFADWRGDLLVAALIAGDAGTPSGHLRRIEMQNGAVVAQHAYLGELEARLRDVRVAPDGSIWVLTDEENGRVLRLSGR